MSQDLSAERVKALLQDPSRALELSEDQLEGALLALIALAGSMDSPRLLDKIGPVYRHAMSRLHPARRLRSYQLMADRVIAGEADARALLPFLVFDRDRPLVSAAALDYALLSPDDPEEPLAGVDFLLDVSEQGGFANGPAVLGGLLMSADRRILARLKPLVRLLSCEGIEELIQCRGRFLTAGVVEFYLDWLEQLDSVRDADAYGAVAAGLANLAISHDRGPVHDIERVIPGTPEEAVRIVQQWTFADYAALIAPRLQVLAEREEGEPVITEVMAIWNIG